MVGLPTFAGRRLRSRPNDWWFSEVNGRPRDFRQNEIRILFKPAMRPKQQEEKTNMKTRHTLTLIAMSALVAVTAFGILRDTRQAQAKESVSGKNAIVTKTDPADGPAGVYTTTITPADIPPDLPPEVVGILVGEWQIELTENGANIVSKGGEVVVIGRYTDSPSHVVLRDEGGPLACFDAPGIATGIYTWSFQNDELTLTPVLDRCFGRQLVLSAHPLQKQ